MCNFYQKIDTAMSRDNHAHVRQDITYGGRPVRKKTEYSRRGAQETRVIVKLNASAGQIISRVWLRMPLAGELFASMPATRASR